MNRRAETHFKMVIHKRYQSALDRQVREALNIAKAGDPGSTQVMNRMEKYSRDKYV